MHFLSNSLYLYENSISDTCVFVMEHNGLRWLRIFSSGIHLHWELYGMNTKINLLADFGIDPPPSAEVSEICWWMSEMEELNSWKGMTCHIFIQFVQRV